MLVVSHQIEIDSNIVDHLDIHFLKPIGKSCLVHILLHWVKVEGKSLVLSSDWTPQVQDLKERVLLKSGQ